MKVLAADWRRRYKSVFLSAIIMSATACGGSSGGDGSGSSWPVAQKIPQASQRVIPTEEVRPFLPDSRYASVLYSCIMIPETIEQLCPLSELPYIGQNDAAVRIDEIMQRVLVTHDWMGVRFQEMLGRLPLDLVHLFAPVTAIVIGSDVRPSSFTPALGMIMIDADFLWLSTAERQTISIEDDFRTDFGSGLSFVGLTRAMQGDEYTSYYWPEGVQRKHRHILLPLARMLYHELAHANDYIQRGSLSDLDDSHTAYSAIEALAHRRISTLIVEDESLTTQNELFDELAAVRYRDAEPTDEHKSAQADFVGAMHAAAGKISFYSYSSPREDVATLFELAMMKYHYDVDMHVGFANKPANEDNAECDDYIVSWGVRNRLASQLVIARADFVVSSILRNESNVRNLINHGLGQVVPLREGDGWCESRPRNPSRTQNDQPVNNQPDAQQRGRPIEILRAMQPGFR